MCVCKTKFVTRFYIEYNPAKNKIQNFIDFYLKSASIKSSPCIVLFIINTQHT